MISYKLVREDFGSLCDENRVIYGEEWQTVPGNGAYCSDTGDGITSGGAGPVLIALEVEDPTGAYAPDGVTCYRRVRRVGVVPLPAECARAAAERARARAEYDRALAACAREWAAYDRAWDACARVRDACEQIAIEVIKEYERKNG